MDCGWKKPKGTKLKYVNRSVSNRPNVFFLHTFHGKYICLDSTIFVWKEPKAFMDTTLFKKAATEQQGYGPLWLV